MGCECARLKKEEPEVSTRSIGVQVDEEATPVLRLKHIRRITEPISALYQVLPQAQGKASFVQAQVRSTGQTCVLRMLAKDKVVKGKVTRSSIALLLGQIHALDHPNILRPFELLEDQSHFYISYLSLTPLLAHLAHLSSLPETLYASIMVQLLSALSYAHNCQCLHTTLDLDCLLVRSSSTSSVDICVGGFEKQIEGSRAHLSAYEAPETFMQEPGDKADVWSCGVILYHLLSGHTPFHPIKYTAMVARGKRMLMARPESEVSEEALNLLGSMLQWSPEKRPSLSECLLHPWLQQVFAFPPPASPKVIKNMLQALGKKQPRSILREAIKYYIVFRVEQSQNLDDMTAMFRYFDTNADGKISESELQEGLRKWIPDSKVQAKAKQIMATADLDSSGYLDYSEFLLSSLNEEVLLSPSNLLIAFNSLDRDHSGKLSIQELKDIFAICAIADKAQGWVELIRELDKDGDEQVDFQEFKRLMTGN